VGTQGAVKAASPRDLRDLGVQVVMANAYHLAMRPGPATVAALGGLHAMAGWDGPMMADSGGFQVFSLETRRQIDPDGVTFQSHVDGSEHRFTPESVVRLQETLGADLIMPLDVCTPYPVDRRRARADLELTHAWARRSLRAHNRADQLLYGIVQGSTFPDLRAEGARAVAAMGFEAFAVGGVSVGESKPEMLAALASAAEPLPEGAPRHLLGVGHPEDIVAAVAYGMDTFDCVMPTRVARNAGALTMDGRINLRNADHARDVRPLQDGCTCYACQNFSRGAVRHLVKAGEILALQLLTVHNLHFLVELMRGLRAAIQEGRYESFRHQFLSTYAGGAHAASGSHE
jgi:queuine tRNA-ribosyltransferase